MKTDMMIHTTKTEMMKLVVEIKCVGMNADEFDKETRSSDRLQPKQADLSYVHALNEPHFREIYVVPIEGRPLIVTWVEGSAPCDGIEPIPSGNLPPEFDPNTCCSLDVNWAYASEQREDTSVMRGLCGIKKQAVHEISGTCYIVSKQKAFVSAFVE
nr:hypothetical protein [Tanacetum cinerariifolium]